MLDGEVAEWSIAAVLKTAEPARVPGVRIPLSPPKKQMRPEGLIFFRRDARAVEWGGLENR